MLIRIVDASLVSQAALQQASARASTAARPLALVRMQEEAPKADEPAAVPTPAPVTPPPAPADEGIDLTKYSMTITLGLVFVGAKAADYLGLISMN
jgi:hypothetical protein